jgi:hypothetical protein
MTGKKPDGQKRDERRIRERAHRLWLEEGRPDGGAEAFWDMAKELVAIEDSQKATLLPNPTEDYEASPTTEPVEPLEAVKNAGEFPTLTDQGEEATFPSRERAGQTSGPPLGHDKHRPRGG